VISNLIGSIWSGCVCRGQLFQEMSLIKIKLQFICYIHNNDLKVDSTRASTHISRSSWVNECHRHVASCFKTPRCKVPPQKRQSHVYLQAKASATWNTWHWAFPSASISVTTRWDPHLGHGVGGRAFVQKQERHLLVIVMCCDVERGEAILHTHTHTHTLSNLAPLIQMRGCCYWNQPYRCS